MKQTTLPTSATTPEGILQGLNQKFTRESKLNPMPFYTSLELSVLMTERLREMEKIRQKDKDIRKKLRVADAEGWKSKDELIFEHIGEMWEVTEHRKDKLSGEIAHTVHKIPEINVVALWDIIKRICPTIGTSATYRKLVPSVIEHYHFPLELEEFNGGRNRKTYFAYYYFVLKILEHLGKIRYGGRGKIVRLTE